MSENTEEVVVVPNSTVVVQGVFTNETGLTLPDKNAPITERSSAIRDILKKAAFIDNKLQLAVGEALYEVVKNGYWKDWKFSSKDGERNFASWDEYLEYEMRMKKRKAAYLVDIYDTFIVRLGVPQEQISDLEWSKVKEITKIVNETNWKDVVDKIRPLSVTETQAFVDNFNKVLPAPTSTSPVNTSTPPAVGEKFHGFKVNLSEGQLETVKNALEIAKVMTKSEKEGYQLELICAEFIQTYVGNAEIDHYVNRIEDHIKRIEKAFGVKIKVEGVDSEVVPAFATSAT